MGGGGREFTWSRAISSPGDVVSLQTRLWWNSVRAWCAATLAPIFGNQNGSHKERSGSRCISFDASAYRCRHWAANLATTPSLTRSLTAFKTYISWAWANIKLERAARVSVWRSNVGTRRQMAEAAPLRLSKILAACCKRRAANRSPWSVSKFCDAATWLCKAARLNKLHVRS